MKKTIFTLFFTTLIAGVVLIGCKPSTKEGEESQENVQDANEKVEDAKDDLTMAKQAASAEEWKAFQDNTDSIINENEIQITELKSRMKEAGKSIDANYKKTIVILEEKNKELKARMDTYKNDSNSDWQSFKREFKHDKDELGKALKDLTLKNTK
jgi:outer membrane murein-binding lipoprotein Lpp